MPDLSLRLLVLRTPNVLTAMRFYASLGFSFKEEQHGKGPIHYSAQLCDGIIEIYPLSEGQTVDTTTRLGFGVEDVEAVTAAAADNGGRVVRDGHQTPWGYVAILADPDGRSVEIYQA